MQITVPKWILVALGMLAVAGVSVGATLLVTGDDDGDSATTEATDTETDGGESPTDSAEAGQVEDVASQYAKDAKAARDAFGRCLDIGGDDPSGAELVESDRCIDEQYQPLEDSAGQTVQDSIRDLAPEVGPECRRALRAARSATNSQVDDLITEVEEALSAAVSACRPEGAD